MTIFSFVSLNWLLTLSIISSSSGYSSVHGRLAMKRHMTTQSSASILGELTKYNPTDDSLMSKTLEGLASCTIETLANEVKAIRMGEDVLLPSSATTLARNTIYARNFYPQLLTVIRNLRKVILLGTPGAGTSMLQFYYLARVVNPEVFKDDPLPPDVFGSTEPPKFVIRQIADTSLTVLFLEEKKAFTFPPNSVEEVLNHFDAEHTIYFFEPSETVELSMTTGDRVAYHGRFTITPMLAAFAPEKVRLSKDYPDQNPDATVLGMPLFSEDELVTIGKDMLAQPEFPHSDTAFKELYSEESIRSRFKIYNGKITFVLPRSTEFSETAMKEMNEAIDNVKITPELIEMLLRGFIDVKTA